MKLRVLLAAVLTLLLGVCLTACQTKVGAAAVVDGSRITESSLQDYVQPGAKSFEAQNGTIVPRTFVLQQLITRPVLSKVLDAHGGRPTAAELGRARTAALGTTTLADATKQITERGFDASFTPLYLQVLELENVLRERIPDQTALGKAITGTHVDVSVSARYGTWDASTLTLKDGPGNPDFIATTSASPSATPAG